jgi:hypothetical protein
VAVHVDNQQDKWETKQIKQSLAFQKVRGRNNLQIKTKTKNKPTGEKTRPNQDGQRTSKTNLKPGKTYCEQS